MIMKILTLVMLASLVILLCNVWSYLSLIASTQEPRKILQPQRHRRKTQVGYPALP